MFRYGDTRICNKIWKHFYPSEGELVGQWFSGPESRMNPLLEPSQANPRNPFTSLSLAHAYLALPIVTYRST